MQSQASLTCSEHFLHAVPAPSHVILRQNKINPIRPVGSNVTLTCTVELPSTVAFARVQLTVSIQLADPDGNTLSGVSTMQVSTSTYISRATITSFERHHSGMYSCEATISSNSPYLSESSILSEEILLHSGKLPYLMYNRFLCVHGSVHWRLFLNMSMVPRWPCTFCCKTANLSENPISLAVITNHHQFNIKCFNIYIASGAYEPP